MSICHITKLKFYQVYLRRRPARTVNHLRMQSPSLATATMASSLLQDIPPLQERPIKKGPVFCVGDGHSNMREATSKLVHDISMDTLPHRHRSRKIRTPIPCAITSAYNKGIWLSSNILALSGILKEKLQFSTNERIEI